MTTTTRAARGASAYTEPDYYPTLDCDRYSAPPDGWAELTAELQALRSLEDDWDGQGALAPPPPLVDTAISLALCLRAGGTAPADRAIAGVNGTIILEWHAPHGYLEIEVTDINRAEARKVPAGAQVAEPLTLILSSRS
jgi:hypothetical protein